MFLELSYHNCSFYFAFKADHCKIVVVPLDASEIPVTVTWMSASSWLPNLNQSCHPSADAPEVVVMTIPSSGSVWSFQIRSEMTWYFWGDLWRSTGFHGKITGKCEHLILVLIPLKLFEILVVFSIGHVAETAGMFIQNYEEFFVVVVFQESEVCSQPTMWIV